MLSKSRGLARRNVVRPFEAALAPESTFPNTHLQFLHYLLNRY